MGTPFISRFTPSLMAPETLEALLVQREPLVEEIIQGIRRSASTKAKHHVLLIAPRGLGKTHLVAVVYNRVKGDKKLQSRLRVAWLREEERGVTTFLELLVRILTALAREYADAGLQEELQHLYDLPRKESEHAAATLLTEYLGKRTLLLLVENLDAIFAGLKDAGQKALRAYLQEHPVCTTVATATSLFGGVSLQKSVFYGFFNISHLGELSVDDAVALLARIAEVRGDAELAAFVRTPIGRARVRAVHHIAGGNHRIYVVFSEFLSRSSLDELVDPFMRMLDDLTPYYQGRMDLLSPQQQQVVEFLAHAQGAQPVKEIARRCFLSQQTAASQLRDLKQKGYVAATTPQSDKRETYYELREPLMRLCFEVKEYRGGPIRLFVDFLRYWYSRDELQQRLEGTSPRAGIELACLRHALESTAGESADPRVDACMDDLVRHFESFEFAQAAKVAEELVGLVGTPDFVAIYAWLLLLAGRPADALPIVSASLRSDPDSIPLKVVRSDVLAALGQSEEAEAVLEDLLVESRRDVPHSSLWLIANSLVPAGRYSDALAIADRCVAIAPDDPRGWALRGEAARELGRNAEALRDYDRALALDRCRTGALVGRALCLHALGRADDALDAIDAVSHIPPVALVHYQMLSLRGHVLANLRRDQEAVAAFDAAISHGDSGAPVWLGRGDALTRLARLDEAMDSFVQAVANDDTDEAATVLVSVFRLLRHVGATAEARSRWLSAWRDLTTDRRGPEAPLVLLEAGVEYLNSGDDRALLQLPVEARKLVMSLLGMERDAEAEPGSPE